MNYIICSGGLGNQMFQYAFYYVMKKKLDNLSFDISSFSNRSIHNGFELEDCFGVCDYTSKDNITNGINGVLYKIAVRLGLRELGIIKIERVNSFISDIPWNNSIIYGYWQSPMFFDDYRAEIKEVFDFKNISIHNRKIAEKMNRENSVAIHIRRGDYLTASHYYVLSESNYYNNCIHYLETQYQDLNYYVFSDDPEWCHNSNIFPDGTTYVNWNNGKDSYQDMFLISQSKFCVTANSTFSWWAAYLGNHNEVLCPSVYKDDWDKTKIMSFYPKEWKKISVEKIQ